MTLNQVLIYAPLASVDTGDGVVNVPVLMSRPAYYVPLLLLQNISQKEMEKLRSDALVVTSDALPGVLSMGNVVAVPTSPGPVTTFAVVWNDKVLSKFQPHAALYVYKTPELDALLRLSRSGQ